MSAGDVTQGKRREAGASFPDLGVGEYALNVRADALRRVHPVAARSGWHGFLERGVWREV